MHFAFFFLLSEREICYFVVVVVEFQTGDSAFALTHFARYNEIYNNFKVKQNESINKKKKRRRKISKSTHITSYIDKQKQKQEEEPKKLKKKNANITFLSEFIYLYYFAASQK